ncbi:MAG: phage baseplate assembly protein V [Parvibaculaceae bacterium]|nr:phage baseplate assembly protein V [Parvibaculaceae bacterium]
MSYSTSEIARRLENVIRRGTIASVDAAKARVTVKLGNIETAPLPFFAQRAGDDRDWWCPSLGEQVVVFSEGGDFANGVVLTGLYQAAHPAPFSDPKKSGTHFGDGATATYDRQAHRHIVDVPSNGEILLTVGASSLSIKNGSITLATPQFNGVQT